MNKKVILVLILLAFISFNNFVYPEQSGGVFLEMVNSAKAVGLGENFVAVCDDVFGLRYNPAGASVCGNQLSYMRQFYIQDFYGDFIGGICQIPEDNVSIGIAGYFLGMKEEPIYNRYGGETGEKFKYGSSIYSLTLSYKSGNLTAGTSFKFYSEEIGKYKDNQLTADFGYLLQLDRFQLGISGLNLLGDIADDFSLPKTIKAGISYVYKKEYPEIFSGFTISTEYDYQIVRKKYSVGIGGEIGFANIVFIRSGYKLKEDFGVLNFGFGIKIKRFNLDYSLSNLRNFGLSHNISVSLLYQPN